MSDDWTPTTDEVRAVFASPMKPGWPSERAEAFDRWLDRYRADCWAEADEPLRREARREIAAIRAVSEKHRGAAERVVELVAEVERLRAAHDLVRETVLTQADAAGAVKAFVKLLDAGDDIKRLEATLTVATTAMVDAENRAEQADAERDALAAVIERVRDVTATAIDEAEGDEIVLDALGPAWGALDAAPADLLADHDRETRARAFEDAAIIAASVEGVNPDARRVIARALNEQAEKAKGGGDQ